MKPPKGSTEIKSRGHIRQMVRTWAMLFRRYTRPAAFDGTLETYNSNLKDAAYALLRAREWRAYENWMFQLDKSLA